MGGFVFVFVTPDFVQDLVVGQHPTGVFHQMVEQTVFGRAKLNEFAFDPNFMTIKVNREAVVNDDFSGFFFTPGSTAAQDRADATGQFTWLKGLVM